MPCMAASVDLSPSDAWVGTGLRLPLLSGDGPTTVRLVTGAELIRPRAHAFDTAVA